MNTSLKDFLMNQPAGAELDLGDVEFLLAETWDSLRGSHVEGMRAQKIRGRTEKLAWNPPLLTFSIERHGGTVNVKGPAVEIANAILNNVESDKLKRYPDGRVKVLISAVVPPHGFKQTISGRRKRFRAALEGLIKEHGWVEVGFNTYERRQAS